MTDPRIEMLESALEARRAELSAAFHATTPGTREVVPPEGGWSVTMVLEHLGQTEGAVARVLSSTIGSVERRSSSEPFDGAAFSRHLEMPAFVDRTRKLKGSQPSGQLSATQAWDALEASRRAVREVLGRSVGLRLEDLHREHPTGAILDGYQWIAFVGLHETRHAEQIAEIEARLASAAPHQREKAASRTPLSRRGHQGYPMLELRLPREDEEAELLHARAAASDAPQFLHYYEKGMSLVRYLEVLQAQVRGEGLPPNHVPTTFLFAFDEGRVVGRTSIRHHLNERLLRMHGHIGYVVVPEFRRRGYATAILRQSLEIAHGHLGIGRVLVTCDDDNVGSIRTIERNGGVLENVVTGPDLPKPKRRYWIDLSR